MNCTVPALLKRCLDHYVVQCWLLWSTIYVYSNIGSKEALIGRTWQVCTGGESPQSLITLSTSVLCYLATDAINLKMHFEFGFALIIAGVTLLRPKCPPPSPGTACSLPIAHNHNHGEAHTHGHTHGHTHTHTPTHTNKQGHTQTFRHTFV